MIVEGVLLAGLVATATGAGAFALHRRARRAEAARAEAEARSGDLSQTLDGLPDGCYRWNADGGEACSARLAVLLNLPQGTAARFADLRPRFEPEVWRELDAAVQHLRGRGGSFDLMVPLIDDGRWLQAVGRRIVSAEGAAAADLLWLRETLPPALDEGVAVEADRFRILAEALPMPVWLRDGSGDVVFASGARAEDAALRDLARRALAEGRPATAALPMVLHGVRCLADVTEVPLPEGGSMGFALDRTAAEEAEVAQVLAVGTEAAVLDNLGTAIAIFDADSGLRYFNRAYRDLWRLEADWLLGAPTYGAILERLRERRRLPEVADFKAFKDEQTRLFATLERPAESLMHLPDGLAVRMRASRHPTGGLIFAYEDVTDRLELESNYKTLLAVQRETLDNLYEGIAVFGSDGRLRLYNPAFADLWNLAPGELDGEPHIGDWVEKTRAFYAEGDDSWPLFRERMIARWLGRQSTSGRIERSDGTVLDHASVPLPDGAVLLSYLDVTDEARVERALRERAEAMQAADRLKSQFIANLSYEVRTPLTTLLGFAEILAEEYFGKLNPRQAEYARGIQESGQALLALLSDVIDLATIEAGQMALELDTVDLHSLLAHVLGLIRERARRRGLNLDFDCSPDIGWIVADEKRLKQLLFHLLSNAVAFNRPGGSVALSARRDAHSVELTVSDSGIGIPEADQARVFASFERGRGNARSVGAGLGLSLVKRFVELHGGTVDLESAPNRGTTVRCRLPV